jgi:hypothetical protein
MRRLLRIPLLAAALGAAQGTHAQVTAECPLIRPPGLAADQVEAIVAQKVGAQIERPPEALVANQTFHKQDGTDNASTDFAYASIAIAQALGFDAPAAYRAAAKARGSEQPSEVLTLADMQEIARKAYLEGHDGPPPALPAGVAYRLRAGLTVHTPAPPDGWQVQRCASDQVAFRRSEDGRPPLETAMARLVGVPRWTNEEAFEKTVRATVEATTAGMDVRATTLAPVAGTSVPCVDLRVTAVASGQPLGLRGRVCYAARDAEFAYLTLFSRLGDDALSSPAAIAQADAFIAGASPK